MAFTLTSPAFFEGGDIPPRQTCDGAALSPPLSWHELPDGTQSCALILHDPDSTKKPDFTHWVLFDIPPGTGHLAEGVGDALGTPGQNDFEARGYGGPCPAVGRHRYIFDLYALDVAALGLGERDGREAVEAAMEGHLLGRARLTAHFERTDRPSE